MLVGLNRVETCRVVHRLNVDRLRVDIHLTRRVVNRLLASLFVHGPDVLLRGCGADAFDILRRTICALDDNPTEASIATKGD